MVTSTVDFVIVAIQVPASLGDSPESLHFNAVLGKTKIARFGVLARAIADGPAILVALRMRALAFTAGSGLRSGPCR
jgi:hypothetical protein